MSIILFAIFGLIVGFLARAILPGRQKMGILATMLLGVVGSYLGGFLVALISSRRVTDFTTAGFFGSVIGAIIVLAIVSGTFHRRSIV
jgi:uncharacterized membrane protein YeaQ/YmgE (transglycosylase-associated protein family)